MQTFTYVARDPESGKQIHSQIEADDEKGAVKAIKDKGYAPLELHAAKSKFKKSLMI